VAAATEQKWTVT